MSISFDSVPSNLRIPFVAVEINNSKASQGPSLLNYRALLVGQKISAGTGTANTLYKVSNADQVLTFAGRGSQLHRQALSFFRNNQFTECWIGVLADNGSGVLAAGTLTVTGPATAAGTLQLYIAGTLVSVAVASGDAATAVAANINTAINAAADLPVTSSVSSAVVTVTARNKGTAGNDIDMRVNYQDGDKTPAGIAVAIVAMASGATNPTLTSLIAAMGDQWFHVIAHPYTDATSLTALEAEMLSRFGPMRQIDGFCITSAAGTQSTLGTLGLTRNSQFSVIVAQPGKSPLTPPAEFAAAVVGVAAASLNADPSRPLQTLTVAGVVAPAESDRFTKAERNLNLYDGIGTTVSDRSGNVTLERLVTTYQTNASGAADASYLDLTTMATLLYLRYSFRTRIQTVYPRHKLSADGTRFGAGQSVLTPKLGRAEAYNWFQDMAELALVRNFDQFKTDLVVEIDPSNPNRMNWLLPPTLVGQFIIGAAQIQFRLS